MICKICGKEFGNGAYCQNCNTDRIKALGNYNGFNVSSNDMISKQSVDKISDKVTGVEYDNEHYQNNAICDFCGEVIPAYSLFCPACGKKRQVECPCCHKMFSAKWKFCPYCGTNVETYSDSSRKEKIEQSKESKESKESENREYYDYNDFIFDKEKYRGQEIITIPQSVKHIHCSTFEGCGWITQINLPNELEAIPHNCFKNCSNLESISIPKGVNKIADTAFEGCKKLKCFKGEMSADLGRVLIKDGELLAVAPAAEIGALYVIPNTVTKISASFGGCNKLEVVRIPESVVDVDLCVFEDCKKLKRFEGKYSADDGRALVKDGELIAIASAGINASYTIPDTVTKISAWFKDCDNLEIIHIPDSVIEITENAFIFCVSLHKIVVSTKERVQCLYKQLDGFSREVLFSEEE